MTSFKQNMVMLRFVVVVPYKDKTIFNCIDIDKRMMFGLKCYMYLSCLLHVSCFVELAKEFLGVLTVAKC